MSPPKSSTKKFAKKRSVVAKLPVVHPDEESSVSDMSDMVDDDYDERAFLLNAVVEHGAEHKKHPRKRRRAQVDAEDEDGEQPREMAGQKLEDSSQKLHFLLPLKSSAGVQMRYRQVENDKPELETKKPKKGDKEKVAAAKTAAASTALFEVKPFATDTKWKQRIASLAFDVLEDPEKNLKCVRELLGGLAEVDAAPVITTAIMASVTEIFKDILPGYRIHVASEVEQDQQMKKETLKLRQHEEGLLGIYQKFLQQLEKFLSVVYAKKELSDNELSKAGHAVKCLSELLVTRIDFNFRKNLIDSLVHISTCRYQVLVEIAVNTIQRVFKQDRQGDATVDVMSSVSKVTKTKGHRISTQLLNAFLDIKVSKELLQSLADDKEKAAKLDRKLLSYKERKHKKELAKVEKEMQSNQLEDNKKLKGRLHSQIIQSVFAIYFRILRREDDKVRLRLLPGVLKGVARFVHFIGVEYMDDLVKTLNGIVESDECRPLEKLLCVRTVFSILSGDGSALNIDPYRFYEHLFKVLQSLTGTEDRALFVELINCVQKGFIERRKLIAADRAARCVKSLAGLALRSPTKESVAVTLLLKAVFLAHPSLDRYLDAEFVTGSVVPSSVGLDGGAANGPLWEVHQLRKHHHPASRALVDALLGNSKALTGTFSRLLHCDAVDYLTDSGTDVFDA